MIAILLGGLMAIQSTDSPSPTSGGAIEESALNATELWPYSSCKALQIGYSYTFEAARVDAASLNDPDCGGAAAETRSLFQQKFAELVPTASDAQLMSWINSNMDQVDLKYASQRPDDSGISMFLQMHAAMNCVTASAGRLDDGTSAPDVITKAAKSACATDRIAAEATVEGLFRSHGSIPENEVLKRTREFTAEFDDLIDGVVFQSVLEARLEEEPTDEAPQRAGSRL